MHIHEATSFLKMHPQNAISRKKWMENGVITKRIMTGLDHLHLFEFFKLDGTLVTVPWLPDCEDMEANDWFEMRPIFQKGKRVGWEMSGLLAARE